MVKTDLKKKVVLISAINDLTVDQRLHKVASSLKKNDFEPHLTGIKYRKSLKIEGRPYKTSRFGMIFKKGPAFYAEFNVRLFFFLIMNKSDILLSNDLDTLPANYLAYLLKKLFSKRIKLVYDSHELFTELPELNGRPFTRNIWLILEKVLVPSLKNAYTVCQSIADYYEQKYKIKMQVIRNMPVYSDNDAQKFQNSFHLPEGKKIILYQGALNIGRGLEEMVEIMPEIDDALLLIAGSGDIEHKLKLMVEERALSQKIYFTGKLPFRDLNQLTQKADIGLVLQQDLSLSYRYVLPNRLFDFMKAGVPVLASNLPEIARIVKEEKIGLLVNGLNGEELLEKLRILLYDKERIQSFKSALYKCASKYYWENDEIKLIELFKNLK